LKQLKQTDPAVVGERVGRRKVYCRADKNDADLPSTNIDCRHETQDDQSGYCEFIQEQFSIGRTRHVSDASHVQVHEEVPFGCLVASWYSLEQRRCNENERHGIDDIAEWLDMLIETETVASIPDDIRRTGNPDDLPAH